MNLQNISLQISKIIFFWFLVGRFIAENESSAWFGSINGRLVSSQVNLKLTIYCKILKYLVATMKNINSSAV